MHYAGTKNHLKKYFSGALYDSFQVAFEATFL
jgi:hypothetical protein